MSPQRARDHHSDHRAPPWVSVSLVVLSLSGCLESASAPSQRDETRAALPPSERAARGRDAGAPAALSPAEECAPCHPRQVESFAGATMAYSLLSPAYNAMEATLMRISGGALRSGGALDAFCSGCHGLNSHHEGQQREREGLNREQAWDPVSGGISCESCHRAHPPGAVSVPPALALSGDKLGPGEAPEASPAHGYRGDPAARAWLRSAEFCAQCHDVRPPIRDQSTGEPFGRLEDLFSEWARSPWGRAEHPLNPLRGVPGIEGLHEGREAAGEVISCQDCHMSLYPYRRLEDRVSYRDHFAPVPPETLRRKADKLYPVGYAATGALGALRRVSSHSFAGASQPLTPFPLPGGDPRWWETPSEAFYRGARSGARDAADADADEAPSSWEAWRRAEAARRDAWGHPLRSFERRRDLLRAAATLSLDALPAEAPREAPLRLDLWVENTGAGHNFPAGFSQERELWIALTVIDEGRSCVEDFECQDLVQRRFFVDDPRPWCEVHRPGGGLDPTLAASPEAPGPDGEPAPPDSWGRRQRRERSGRCDAERGRCVLYRSGYLIDLDGDGRVNDEPLRHELVEESADLERICVLPGPDADQRAHGRSLGLVWFHNELQRIAVDEEGTPVAQPGAERLRPAAPPPRLSEATGPLVAQDPRARRHEGYQAQARYERLRYLPASSEESTGPLGEGARGRVAPHIFAANRFFNGNALRPFEPRLARYELPLPAGVVGPLRVEAALRLRFFSPRTLRVLAAEHPTLLHEALIDEALEIVDVAEGRAEISLRPR